jgi:hypothetical protein
MMLDSDLAFCISDGRRTDAIYLRVPRKTGQESNMLYVCRPFKLH